MKGGENMKLGKILFVAGLIVMLAMLAPGAQVFGGEPPGSTTIVGPELWGVGVINMDASSPYATFRAKRVVDCNVETQAVIKLITISPPDPLTQDYLLGIYFSENLFGILGKPIITKVKNFKQEDGTKIYSFDAQIKFCTAGCP
jgi:hypothetical protein